MKLVLIDTHCHVHVSRDSIAAGETALTPQRCCCSDDEEPSSPQVVQHQKNVNINNIISNNRSSGTGSGSSGSDHTTRAVLVRDDLAEVGNGDEGGRRSMTLPLPEVVHITMGIKEEDWTAALRYSTDHVDNLR